MKRICPTVLPFHLPSVTMSFGGAVAATFWLAVLWVGSCNRYRAINTVFSSKKRTVHASFSDGWRLTKNLFATQRSFFGLTFALTKVKVPRVSAKSLTGIETPKIQSASALNQSTFFLCLLYSKYGGAVKATLGLAVLWIGSFNRYRAITSELKLAADGLKSPLIQRTF